jgi:glycosyltransferase involved in cell wall biosynthesis
VITADASIRIAVIIGVRNEAALLRVLLPLLSEQALDVVLLDNESTDDIRAVLQDNPVYSYRRLPFLGHFSLGQQLKAKQAVVAELDHDWIVHQDADEVLQHAEPTLNLRDAIAEADAGGFNVLNFKEFCFVAEPGSDYVGRNYPVEMRRYYHFGPAPSRLHRAWRRDANLDNLKSLGHNLNGADVRIAPRDHALRHYIALSQAHIIAKYQHRLFDVDELEKGHHWNRVGLTPEMLELPGDSPFFHQVNPGSNDALKTEPAATKHYWQWSAPERTTTPL